MKILAVDYGDSRTGLATCDHTEFLTTPITPQITLKARNKVAARVCEVAKEIGAVHVQRQTDDDELGPDLFGHLTHPGGHLVAGLEGDLRRDGAGKKLGAVAGGKAGAAVPVIHG